MINKFDNSDNRYLLLLQVMADAEDSVASSASTALVEACRNRDIGMADLLLRHSARDDDCKALHLATCNKDDILIAKLLSIKVTYQLSLWYQYFHYELTMFYETQ